MIELIFFILFCLLIPIGTLVATIVAIARYQNRHAPRAVDELAIVMQRLSGWVYQGRLAPDLADRIKILIDQDRAAMGQTPPAAASPPIPPRPSVAPVAAPTVGPFTPPTSPAAVAPPTLGERLGNALAALYTRQTLLALGSFLLVMSGLTLVLFSWSSFSPLVQFALLASAVGGLWASGEWLTRKTNLQRAGLNLQGVAALLAPLAFFALSRPGLLDLAPRGSWLLVSALSLPVYILAAWRTRRMLYSTLAAFAAANVVLAAPQMIEDQWLAPLLAFWLAGYIPLADWLRRRGENALSRGPFWVAHIGLPSTLLLALLLGWRTVGLIELAPLSATLWAGVFGYALVAWLDRRPHWIWVVGALAPVALLTSLSTIDIAWRWQLTTLGALATAYLFLGAALETRARHYAAPWCGISFVVVSITALQTFGTTFAGFAAFQTALPPLMLYASATTLLAHRGRLSWLKAHDRALLATAGLIAEGVLLPLWLLAMFDLTNLAIQHQEIGFLLLSALYFVGAYWQLGRLRRAYAVALQALGLTLGLLAVVVTTVIGGPWLPGALLFAAILIGYAMVQRSELWAASALGAALLSGVFSLYHFAVQIQPDAWIGLGLIVTLVYALGGTLLRHSVWRFWVQPALGWALLSGVLTLMMTTVAIGDDLHVEPLYTGVFLAFATLLVLLSSVWRRAWLGYPAAFLWITGIMLAASAGFFTAWQPMPADLALVLCNLVIAFVFVGQTLRRVARPYAIPYEAVGYATLAFAPLLALGDTLALSLTWATVATLLTFGARFYRLPWLITLACAAFDLALLHSVEWAFLGIDPASAARILLAATWLQAMLGVGVRYGYNAATGSRMQTGQALYAGAIFSGLSTLFLALGAAATLAGAALVLAALLGLIATRERNVISAWGTLGLLLVGLFSLHQALDVALAWNLAWIGFELLGVALLGWVLDATKQRALTLWRRPTTLGPLVVGVALLLPLLALVIAAGDLDPMTFTLATMGLLLATLTVRERALDYGYVAGASLIAAGLCQLADWGFREPQWYVVPAGLYLLALAKGLRRFQCRHRVSRVVEAGALMLLLGTTLGQSLRVQGGLLYAYALWLCAEALIVIGYGMLLRLRVPFVGGIAFFVAGSLWIAVKPLQAVNQWVVFGILGMLMVGAYVLLERRQELLARAGRVWVDRLRSWG